MKFTPHAVGLTSFYPRVITTKTHEIESLEQSFSQRPIDSTRTACTKCHLRAGHTRANCGNECCTTARLCGEEKRQIKDLKTDLQLLKSKHKRLKEERDSLLENMQSSKRTYSQRILTCLINSGKEKYISYLSEKADACKIPDWSPPSNRSDEGLTLEMSAFLPFMVANLRFQPSC